MDYNDGHVISPNGHRRVVVPPGWCRLPRCSRNSCKLGKFRGRVISGITTINGHQDRVNRPKSDLSLELLSPKSP
ncbi:hypothetical protein J6590_025645 [Homalodisca vitripennis]|nr:hypothetical protein J6590_025645 [Homalodisca vitripennis]